MYKSISRYDAFILIILTISNIYFIFRDLFNKMYQDFNEIEK